MRTNTIRAILLAALLTICYAEVALASTTIDKMESGNTVKVVCYGDSITWGETNNGQSAITYPQRLQAVLRDMHNNSNITVVNKGICGIQSGTALNDFNANVLSENPDSVIIMFGINDASGVVLPITTLNQFKSNITAMIDLCKANDIEPFLMSTTPTWSTGYNLNGNKRIYSYGQAAKEVAQQEGVCFIDINKKVSDIFVEGFYNPCDLQDSSFVHFNQQGYSVIADIVAENAFNPKGIVYNAVCGGIPIVNSHYIDSDFIGISTSTTQRFFSNYYVWNDGTTGSFLDFKFFNYTQGLDLYLMAPKSHGGGQIDVYDNGVYVRTIDFFSVPLLYDQEILLMENISPGYHNIELSVSRMNVGSSDVAPRAIMYLSGFKFAQ